MQDLASLQIKVESQQVKDAIQALAGLHREGKQAEQQTGNLSRETRSLDQQSGSLARSVGGMIAKYAGLAAAVTTVKRLASAGFEAAAAVESQSTSLGILLGDLERGSALYSDLQEFSARTPMAVGDLSDAAQMLMSFGVEADGVTDTLQTLGDAALGNSQKLESLSRSYGRVLARGRASMEEVNMAMEAGVPIIASLADQMGVTEEAVFDLVAAGEVTAGTFQSAFDDMTSEGGKFHDGMETLSDTFEGKLSTAMDNIRLLGADMFEPAVEGSKDFLDGVIDVTQQLRRLYQTSGEQMDARLDTFVGATADEIRGAGGYDEIEGQIRGLSEAMFDAAHETRNFEDAARQAREAARLGDDIRRLEEQMRSTVGPIYEVRDAIGELFDRELVTDGEWWENFTAEDRTNQIARLLDDVNVNGDDLLHSSDAQRLAEAGESAVLDWLDNQIQLLGGKRDELEDLQDQLAEILSGSGIQERESSGGETQTGPSDRVTQMIKDRTAAYDDYRAAIEETQLLSDAGFLDEEERIKRLIGANEDYAQTLAGLGEEALQLEDELGMRELDDAVGRIVAYREELERLENVMENAATSGNLLWVPDANPDLPSGGGSGGEDSTEDLRRVYEMLNLTAEQAEELETQLKAVALSLAEVAASSYVDTMNELGVALATSGNAVKTIEFGLWDMLDALIEAIPRLLLMAGVHLISVGQWQIGLVLIAASGLAAVGAGYWAGTNQETDEELLEARASGGPVSAGRPYLVGERGPELMIPRSAGTVVSNAALAAAGGGGGGGNVNVQVINNAPGVRVETREEQSEGGSSKQIKMMIKQVSRETFARGEMDDVMGGRYGLQKRGVSRS